MKISDNGVALLKRFEGLELEAYEDVAGILTIGYGHTGPDVQSGMRISERDAEELLKRDLKPREDAVSRLTRVKLNQNEFDALVSFVYNVGETAFQNSTARRRLNSGDRVGAAEALTWFNKATINGVLREVTGLTRRRAAERALFLEPTNPPIVADNKQVEENSRLTPIEDAPRRPNLLESRSVQGAAVAGGAGAAASSMGRDSADELNQLEDNIENGVGNTAESGQSGESAQTPSSDTPSPADRDPEADIAGGESDNASQAAVNAQSDGDAGPAVTTSDSNVQTGDGSNGSTSDNGDVEIPPAVDTEAVTQSTEMEPDHPSKHEKHTVDAQIQLVLLILIVLSVLYIFLARIDDWWRYRR